MASWSFERLFVWRPGVEVFLLPHGMARGQPAGDDATKPSPLALGRTRRTCMEQLSILALPSDAVVAGPQAASLGLVYNRYPLAALPVL
jgi:hypothetical protein